MNLLLQDLSVVETHRVSENTCMTPLDIRFGLHNIFFCCASISKCPIAEIFPRGSNSFSMIDSIVLGSLLRKPFIRQIKLGVSPVLRGVLSSLEARLDRRPCISLQEFHTDAVTCLLNFIYTGEVGEYRAVTLNILLLSLSQSLRRSPRFRRSL